MNPPIFSLLAGCEQVTDIIQADSIVRAYQFGVAPEEPTFPYVTWQGFGGSPFNNLDARPSGDMVLTQIDIYDTDSDRIYELANAVRYAIELECNVTAFRDLSKDATTGVYHIGLDVMFVLPA